MKRKLAAQKRLDDARNLAAANGGICLTTAPIGERRPFEFTCPNGHRNFFKRYDAVMQGKYCPKCAMQAKGRRQIKYAKEDLDTHAAAKGGACLNSTYLGWDIDHRWRCDQGHEWVAKPRMIIAMGSWCPECAGNKKYTIEELSSLVADRGGKCLELTYNPTTQRSSALWECQFGHKWHARVDMIIRRGDWCPTCARKYGERLCRQIVEKLFDAPFPSVRPKWLRGEKGYPLEIDIFNEGLFGIEYQGPQHKEETGFTHDPLEKINKRDQLKAEICRKRPFVLIEIPEFENILNADGCISAVKENLSKHGIIIPDREISIDYRAVYVNTAGIEYFKELNAYVVKRGGSLVSDHFTGLAHNYEVVCKHGHLFTLNKYDLPRNKWCPECVKDERYRKYCRIVEARGGEMISERYESTSTPMEIVCASGKRFSLTPHQLSHGVWTKAY